jgi:predicted thioredoxin/glutaredoxin
MKSIRDVRVKVHGDGSLSIKDAVAYMSPDALRERVKEVLERLDARKGEDIEEWADRLVGDVAHLND